MGSGPSVRTERLNDFSFRKIVALGTEALPCEGNVDEGATSDVGVDVAVVCTVSNLQKRELSLSQAVGSMWHEAQDQRVSLLYALDRQPPRVQVRNHLRASDGKHEDRPRCHPRSS